MRVNPIEVLGNTLAITPLRFLAAWLAASVGSFAPIVVERRWEAFEDIGWWILFFPFHMLVTALLSSWWALIAIPLVFLLVFKMINFLRNENSGSDLLVIFALAFFITIKRVDPAWISGAIIAVILAALGFVAAKMNRAANPDE